MGSDLAYDTRADDDPAALIQRAAGRRHAGHLREASELCRRALDRDPGDAGALHMMAELALDLGHHEAALDLMRRAAATRPETAAVGETRARALEAAGRVAEAEAAYRHAIELDPTDPDLRCRFASFLRRAGRPGEAEKAIRGALGGRPDHVPLLSGLGSALLEQGRLGEAAAYFEGAIRLAPDDHGGYRNLGLARLQEGRLEEATAAFNQSLVLKRGLRPSLGEGPAESFGRATAAKLRHDIAQYRYLIERGVLAPAFAASVMGYQSVLNEIEEADPTGAIAILSDAQRARIGATYNRLVHLAEAPALIEGALSPALQVDAITARYLATGPGMVFIDSLLRPEALASLRRFCLESTVWFDLIHTRGYLGAYLEEGFGCPLMAQIAGELRARFPAILGPHVPRMWWAYKYDSRLDGIAIHADQAAVNVNFWITPDEANLDPEGGGLIVYGREAPADWDFGKYNGDEERIRGYLSSSPCERYVVPHRQNRALMFNSNLFHETDTIRFGEAYEERRINVTILYGERSGS